MAIDEFVVKDEELMRKEDYFSWNFDITQAVIDEVNAAGEGLFETWRDLAYQKPPDDIIGKTVWFFGVIGQMIMSAMMFPASLGAFLTEETVQAAGMGAYILSSSRNYDLLLEYLPQYQGIIEVSRTAAINMTLLSPIVGSAALQYMDSAALSWMAFLKMGSRKLLEQAEKDEELRQKLMDEQKYGDLYLMSSPGQAEIWIDGVNTELLTPQTFKNMEGGAYDITLRRMDVKTEEWQIYTFTVNIEAGRKKEIKVRIPQNIVGEEDEEAETDGTETDKLPPMIKAEVEGDYAVDGDTFRTTTGERIRILGIDAPEIGRPWADVAGAYLDDLVHGKNISLRIQSHKPLDTHGRTLAICKMYKGDIAELMLSAGYARLMVFEDDIYDPTSYTLAEDMAKERRIGIWGEMP